jgi:predicted transposase YbfD/YdcC
MAAERRVGLDEIVAHFSDLEDPRSPINRRHPLASVLVIALLAVLAGAGGPTAIAAWAAAKEDFLAGLLDLPRGVPGKDVFRRVLMTLRPEAFQAAFASWLKSLRVAAAADAEVDRPVVAIDGKTARRSHDRGNGLGALHCVSAWATEYGLSLGQVACAEKSNEITAIPELIKLIDLEGAIVTIDAMGTQKGIAGRIVEAKADYVLALKGNHEKLHEAAIDYINERWEDDFAGVDARRHRTHDTGHGREETRTYIQLPAPASLPGFEDWPGLRSIGLVVSECVREGKAAEEVRYYISSLRVGVKQFARAVRGHWGVENGCHWSLDVTYREDESRARERHLVANLGWLYRFTLSLLKQHPGKQSLVMKRRSCGWSEKFLMEVLARART